MRSERQTQASRANGAKSRGPVTPEGKLASSRNALTHGMLSGTIVLEGESKERFRALLGALHEELQPQTPIETSLVENMAVARWRQMRIWGMEKAGMEQEMRRQAEASPSTEDAATRTALAFRALSDDSRSLELINRYESRYDRQYLRAHRRLLELRDRRTPPSVPSDPAQPSNETTFPTGAADSAPPTGTPREPKPPRPEDRAAVRKTVFAKGTQGYRRRRKLSRPRHRFYPSQAVQSNQFRPVSALSRPGKIPNGTILTSGSCGS